MIKEQFESELKELIQKHINIDDVNLFDASSLSVLHIKLPTDNEGSIDVSLEEVEAFSRILHDVVPTNMQLMFTPFVINQIQGEMCLRCGATEGEFMTYLTGINTRVTTICKKCNDRKQKEIKQ